MAECPTCEYHKNRAARWRAEAYKQAGHDVIELPWVGLTEEELKKTWYAMQNIMGWYSFQEISHAIEAKLKEKNSGA